MIQNLKTSWSLEKELCNLTHCSDVCEALCNLGLLSSPTAQFQLIGGNWERGGAETYLSTFQFLSPNQSGLTVLIKACATFTPSIDLESVLEEWIRRRRLLSENGVKTPWLYRSGHGVLIEEYVPYELRTVLAAARDKPTKALGQLAAYAATLCRLGFAPVNPFNDLRSHGADIVVVDFGSDLGPPGVVSASQPQIFLQLRQYLLSLGIKMDDREYDKLRILPRV